jgi:hypothetical protein
MTYSSISDQVVTQKGKLKGIRDISQNIFQFDSVSDIVDSDSQPEQKIKSIYKQLDDITNQFGNMFIERVMAIGSLLIEQKEFIGHGNFESWVNNNLPFKVRQARTYMNVYKYIIQNGSSTAVLESINKSNLETVYKEIRKSNKKVEVLQDEKQDKFTKWQAVLESGDQYKKDKSFKSILTEKERIEEMITEKLNEVKELKDKLSKIKEIHSLYWKDKKRNKENI